MATRGYRRRLPAAGRLLEKRAASCYTAGVSTTSMQDVQNRPDGRQLPLNKVGVKNVSHPIQVLDRARKTQATIASVDLFADLPHHFKGTHMSRFIEVFARHSQNIAMPNFLEMLEEIRRALQAEEAFGTVRFPYFIEKAAPVSGQKSFLRYGCSFQGEVLRQGRRRFFVGIEVPVQTLCPCSKEISDRGAHNQRGFVRVLLQMGSFFWIEDIIELIEGCASAPLFTLLKRDDERYITEHAYDHPVFVEDLVREVTVKIESLGNFPWFSVEAENMESIHLHEAYACIERGAKT